MFKEKLQNLIKTGEGKGKKNIENAVVFIIILIVTILIINMIWGTSDEKAEENAVHNTTTTKLVNGEAQENSNSDEVENSIKQILSKINGVGKVDVLITYSESSRVVALYNENSKQSQTQEEDTNGGTRTIEETNNDKEIIFKEENGEKVPVTEKIVMPKMEGALIVAEGANNAEVKTNIIQAVEALTGLSTHKIQVLEMKSDIN